MVNRSNNDDKVRSKEQRMVNREYTEIVDKPRNESSSGDKKRNKDKKAPSDS